MDQCSNFAEGTSSVTLSCQHDFRFEGVRYREASAAGELRPAPRRYYDIYICIYCGSGTTVLLDTDDNLEAAIRYDAQPL